MARLVRGGRVVPLETVRALRDSEQLLAEAREQAEAIRRDAYDEGMAMAQAQAAETVTAAALFRERLLASAQSDAIALAIDVARKIIHRELSLDPELIVDLFREALEAMVLAQSITLRVHPGDLPDLEGRIGQGRLPGVQEGAALSVVPDPAVDRGGCVVESEMGRIDARLEAQLAAIERALRAEDG